MYSIYPIGSPKKNVYEYTVWPLMAFRMMVAMELEDPNLPH